MIYADYTYSTNLNKRKAYMNIDSARRSAISWCRENKGSFVSFYRSHDSHRPFGSMVWFKNDKKPSYFKLQGVDDRYFGMGESEGPFEILPSGKLKQ